MMSISYQFFRTRGICSCASLAWWQYIGGWQSGYGLLASSQVLHKSVVMPTSLKIKDLPAYIDANVQQWLQWEGDALLTRYFLYQDDAVEPSSIWLSAIKASLLSELTINAAKQKKVITHVYVQWQFYLWQTLAWVKRHNSLLKENVFLYQADKENIIVQFNARGIKDIKIIVNQCISERVSDYVAQGYGVFTPSHMQQTLQPVHGIQFV